jgi:1,4-dihydroxy-2-naphthoate octaprenyltransferase
MPSTAQRFLGVYLEVRVIPVLLWSFTGITIGTAFAVHQGAGLRVGDYLAAVAIGVLLQGIVAHTVNDLADWRSGTDRDPEPRVISGGSGTLTGGWLSERDLAVACVLASAAAIGIGLSLAAARGWWLLLFGAIGLAGAVLYTLPPVRLAYRPYAGEAVAFVCVWACGAGSFALQTGSLTATAALAATTHAAGCVAMLMVHHYLDRGPDSRARPPKVTSVVRLGAQARRYACAWGCVFIALSVGAAVVVAPAFVVLAVAAALGLAAHARVAVDDVAAVTRAELCIIALGIVGGLASAAVLAPPLGWALPAAAALFALDLRVASSVTGPARSPKALVPDPETRS